MEEENKKDIIIDEIKHWKASKLLPEHYCDFLLALYTEGDVKEEKEKTSTPFHLILYFLNSLLLFGPFIVLLMNLSGVMSLISMSIAILLSYGTYKYIQTIPKLQHSFSYIIFLYTILLATVLYINTYLHNNLLLFLMVTLQATSWWFLAKKKNDKYVKLVAVITLLITLVIFIIYII
ncbi:hypothetical protein [Saliterribacillus persicus]|uniref:Uncharacterized protein n=1 Tax=Saliterribacillus persicus TaxID=930114 RepID=A0A368XBW8_9BACI|nr:hypothetical protein [Saliterribacillus persicus]RCW65345.1 hypothetical protein DFR57_11174 [Saliterribacillus persicus]